MAVHYLKTRQEDEEEEEEICGGCDTMKTEDGCECRIVACCACGVSDHIYNMNHILKERDDWFEIPFSDKIAEFYCSSCFREDYEENYEDYFE